MVITETDRLLIRTWTLDDVEYAFDIYRHEEVARWLNMTPVPSVEVQKEHLADRIAFYEQKYQSKLGFYALQLKDSKQIVGAGLLKHLPNDTLVEIGWHLNPAYWGKGYASEGANALLRYGFTSQGLDAIYAITMPDNVRSQSVCRRIGMTYLGETDRYHDRTLSFFSISRKDWEEESKRGSEQ